MFIFTHERVYTFPLSCYTVNATLEHFCISLCIITEVQW